ncbi:hypothetical protein BGZ67_008801 [Mortierella alpina]|nr:hypothetical protein BGZ67_008801 [Mortierella alpina]
MVRITVTGRGAILLLGGTVAYIRAWEGGDYLRPDNEHWAHVMAVLWTCAIPFAYCAQLTLTAVHCSRSRVQIIHGPGNGVLIPQVMNDQDTLDMPTLHSDTNHLGSRSETWLDLALTQLAKAPQPGEEFTVPSIYLSDTQSETDVDVDDEYLRKRVARSTFLSSSMVVLAMDGAIPSAAISSRSSLRANEPATDMQEFRLLQMQHQSSQRRIRTLRTHRQQRPSTEDQVIRVLQRQLRDANQNLERLQAFYHQLHPMPGHQPNERRARMDPAEIMHQLHLRNNMSVLQQQVKFTLRQLDHRIKDCQQRTD